MDFGQLEALAKVVAAFGAPFWAGAVLYLFYQIWRILSGGFKVLQQRDADLQKMIDNNAATADKRMALMEQMILRHDQNIIAIFNRFETDRADTPIPRTRR